MCPNSLAANVQGLPSGTALKYKVDLTIKSKIDMKKLSLPPSAVLATNLLLVAVLVLSVFYAAYNFGTNLKKDIEDKKIEAIKIQNQNQIELANKKAQLDKEMANKNKGKWIPILTNK